MRLAVYIAMLTDRKGERSENPTPYFSFPDNPKIIQLGSFSVYQYLSPGEMLTVIKNLSETVNLNSYEKVLVNLKGGLFFFKQLASLQGYGKRPTLIEYHRPQDGHGAIITTPVPENCVGKKTLVVDDILDSGGVLKEIFNKVSPESEAAVIVTKRGIDQQFRNDKIYIASEIDDVWIGGCGMDLGVRAEEDIFRNYPGIVVKIPS